MWIKHKKHKFFKQANAKELKIKHSKVEKHQSSRENHQASNKYLLQYVTNKIRNEKLKRWNTKPINGRIVGTKLKLT